MGSIGIQFGNLENYPASIADQDSKNSNELFVKKLIKKEELQKH